MNRTQVTSAERMEQWGNALAQSGLRITEPRQTILEAILRHDGPFTAEALVEQLKDQGIGRATVFRTLDLLGELKILHRIHGGGRNTYTACPPEHHHHLICGDCGRTLNVDLCGLEEQIQRLARETDFTIDEHHLEFLGRCPDCRAHSHNS